MFSVVSVMYSRCRRRAAPSHPLTLAQCNMAQHSTAWHGAARHSTAHYGPICRAFAWCWLRLLCPGVHSQGILLPATRLC